MASTHSTFESSELLPVVTPKPLVYAVPVDNEEALRYRMPVRLSAATTAPLNLCDDPR
jgi:hypothetical protein